MLDLISILFTLHMSKLCIIIKLADTKINSSLSFVLLTIVSKPIIARNLNNHMTCIPRQQQQHMAAARVSIPGLPFPGRLGFPDFFHSQIPGNETKSFPWKTGTVQLMVLRHLARV